MNSDREIPRSRAPRVSKRSCVGSSAMVVAFFRESAMQVILPLAPAGASWCQLRGFRPVAVAQQATPTGHPGAHRPDRGWVRRRGHRHEIRWQCSRPVRLWLPPPKLSRNYPIWSWRTLRRALDSRAAAGSSRPRGIAGTWLRRSTLNYSTECLLRQRSAGSYNCSLGLRCTRICMLQRDFRDIPKNFRIGGMKQANLRGIFWPARSRYASIGAVVIQPIRNWVGDDRCWLKPISGCHREREWSASGARSL